MKKEIKVKVVEFSEYPGPRYKTQGSNSGQEFYEKFLKLKFQEVLDINYDFLVVDLDGTAGYASSFIDEAFGNLLVDYNYQEVIKKLKIISIEEESWEDVIFNETLPQWNNKLKSKNN